MGGKTGGQLTAWAIKNHGIDTIFTLCGFHISDVYNGCIDEGIRIVDTRHEQAAGHAADGYARLTRKAGVAVVTAGPGVTDAVTAVANAYMANSPLVLIGGAAPVFYRGNGGLQEIEQCAMFRDITKWSVSISEVRRIPEILTSAFRIAESGRPGPVFVELPYDIQGGMAPDEQIEYPRDYQTRAMRYPDPAYIEKAAQLLRKSERPLMIAGTNVYWDDASADLVKFAEHTGIPVFTNGMGRGTMPMDHPLFFSLCRSPQLMNCDLLINIGTPFDFRIGYGKAPKIHPDAKVVYIDNAPEVIGKNRPVDVGMDANSKAALQRLLEATAKDKFNFKPWVELTREREHEHSERQQAFETDNATPMNSFRLSRAISDYVDTLADRDDVIVVCDGGDFVANFAKVFKLRKPGRFLDPGPLGCLGMGAPMALAAKHTYPDKKVLLIYGDGSFGFNGFELESAVRLKLPIVTVVGNDAAWNQIRAPQVMIYGEERAVGTRLSPTRYDKIVEGFGGKGEHVENPADIGPALKRAFDSNSVYCINVALNPKGNLAMGAGKNYAM